MPMPGFYTVDRIEGGLILLEAPDGTMLQLPREALPEGTGEGDKLLADERGGYRLCPEERCAAMARNRDRLHRLRDRSRQVK